MIKSFDFYFDFISPYSFFAHKEILKIEKKIQLRLDTNQYYLVDFIIYTELKLQHSYQRKQNI